MQSNEEPFEQEAYFLSGDPTMNYQILTRIDKISLNYTVGSSCHVLRCVPPILNYTQT